MRTLPLSSRLCGHPWLSSVRIFFGVQFSSLASSDTVHHIFGSLGKRIMRVRGSCANSTVCHHATSAKASLSAARCCAFSLLRAAVITPRSHETSLPSAARTAAREGATWCSVQFLARSIVTWAFCWPVCKRVLTEPQKATHYGADCQLLRLESVGDGSLKST